jgi:hypothetical protein
MRRILIISRYFHPEMSPRAHRTTELALELDRIGEKVEVALPTTDYDYSGFLKDTNIKLLFYGSVRKGPIKLGKGKFGILLSRIIFRMLSLASDYPHGQLLFKVKRFLKGREGYDLIISVAQPHPIHWGVAAARRRNPKLTKVWIADCGDPFSGTTTDTFKKMAHLKRLENRSFDQTDFITIPISGAMPAYHPRFHSRIHIIPQGFQFRELPVVKLDTDGVSPCFAYSGAFIMGFRDPRKFLDYILGLDMDYRFYIFTRHGYMIKSWVEKSGGRIILKDYVPRDSLISNLKSVDFLINIDNNTGIHTPSKLIDYIQTDRPVLNIENQLNTDAIDAFMRGDYSQKMELPDKDYYDIRNLAQKFLSL